MSQHDSIREREQLVHFSFTSLANTKPKLAGADWAWLQPIDQNEVAPPTVRRPRTLASAGEPISFGPVRRWTDDGSDVVRLVEDGCIPTVRQCEWEARADEYYRANAGRKVEPRAQRFVCPNRTTNQISFTQQSTK